MIWLFMTTLMVIAILVYWQFSLLKSTLILGGWLAISSLYQTDPLLWGLFGVIFVPLNLPVIRQKLLSRWAFDWMQSALPTMSRTEQEAMEAGNTWWDAELFSGTPDWEVLLKLPKAKLSEQEQQFIDGPVETLCAMLDDWEITQQLDLSSEVWAYIKQHKFCGMIIPKQYGGLEFSHFAHSQVVMKIASRSASAAVTVMVPNSLGPAKLLLAYGTESQKDNYLPRLASGTEIPCFALTGPEAGSDAGAMPDTGIVCHADFNGQHHVLGIRLDWEKRYITLGPVATLLGLAFKLYDPEHLLGNREEIGITVALIPTDTPGVEIGNRHFPLNAAFQNGPNWGKAVFIPLDWVLGGSKEVGNGWKMLMQSLATGRSISLPALSAGAGKLVCRNAGAYARIRQQFNRSLGDFEGIQTPLARMAGETYIINAARTVTAAALDAGEQPSVISAIIKYELTERMRQIVNDGMDIHGGSGICLGPRNYLGRLYQTIPICITVEGANILTRTLMIFGQGAVRCHPFVFQEIQALHQADKAIALAQFDRLLFKHIGLMMQHPVASFWLGLTQARGCASPGDLYSRKYYRQIRRLSVNFAWLADYAMLVLGGSLKRKERISGYFADVLSNLYLCSCVLKFYQDQGSLTEDSALLQWGCEQTLYQAESALYELFQLLPFKPVVWSMSKLMFPWGRSNPKPNDSLTDTLAAILLNDTATRDRLTQGIYINDNANDPTGRIEQAFKAALQAIPVEKKLYSAQKNNQLTQQKGEQRLKQAVEKAIITTAEADLVRIAEQTRRQAIAVDDFTPDVLKKAAS